MDQAGSATKKKPNTRGRMQEKEREEIKMLKLSN